MCLQILSELAYFYFRKAGWKTTFEIYIYFCVFTTQIKTYKFMYLQCKEMLYGQTLEQ